MSLDIEFADEDLARLETDISFEAGLPNGVAKAFRKRMAFIRAARDERDFYSMKSLHYEKLKGNRQHQHSMRLNDQWRLVLEIVAKSSNKTIIIISIEDYH
jgi:proteic killer suppression protein